MRCPHLAAATRPPPPPPPLLLWRPAAGQAWPFQLSGSEPTQPAAHGQAGTHSTCRTLTCCPAVDLASQLVLSVAEHSAGRYDPRFPIGRGKLEALAVIACASIMSVASLEVVQLSGLELYNGWAKGGCAAGGGGEGRGGVGRPGCTLGGPRRPARALFKQPASCMLPLTNPPMRAPPVQASGRRWSWGQPCLRS